MDRFIYALSLPQPFLFYTLQYIYLEEHLLIHWQASDLMVNNVALSLYHNFTCLRRFLKFQSDF